MTDIVERLRSFAVFNTAWDIPSAGLAREAAVEINRLRAERDQLKTAAGIDDWCKQFERANRVLNEKLFDLHERLEATEAERNKARTQAMNADIQCERDAERAAKAEFRAQEAERKLAAFERTSIWKAGIAHGRHSAEDEIAQSQERATIALNKVLDRLHEVEALRINLEAECNQLRESLSIADAACRTYWGWEYGRPGDEDDDDIPDSSLLVKWRHDYVKRK